MLIVAQVTSTSVRSMKAAFIIDGARHLRLPLHISTGISQAATFVSKLSELFVHSVRLEVKHAISALLRRLSTSLIAERGFGSDRNNTLDYSSWNTMLKYDWELELLFVLTAPQGDF